jgi:heavy metal translocating P-type ATPase
MVRRLWDRRERLLFVIAAALLLAGVVAYLVGGLALATHLWVAATVLGLLYSAATVALALWSRRPSVDIIALLALVGALLVDEAFAGAVVALMLATGAVLEQRANARARQELSKLAARAPRTARRIRNGMHEVPVTEIVAGDRLLVGSGEIVPVDGRLGEQGVFDESALTGESQPVERKAGEDVRSGVVNAGKPVQLLAMATAAESTYAGVVRLAEQAQAASAPFVRIADRLAVAFVPLTLALAAGAWVVAQNPVRAVAVLVVATPCPLLIAAPIAVMSGLSRAARRGVVVKGGAALEQLAAGKTMLFDKTGTLTQGRPTLTDVMAADGVDPDELLRMAASLDQASPHLVAASIVQAARARNLTLGTPEQMDERPGEGIHGVVEGKRVRLGNASGVIAATPAPAWARRARLRAELDGSLTVFVAIDDLPAGVLFLDDPVRSEAPRMIRALRGAGVTRVALITGDRADIAESVGRVVGVDAVYAERDPAEKLAIVREEQRRASTIMVGDGINDAPALAAAAVGVALAARGSTAAAEAADVVLMTDRIDALGDAMLDARRARRIALVAVGIGMGLSLMAMAAAAAGQLSPPVGAVLQEGIDVASILIALTALIPVRTSAVHLSPAETATARALHEQHRTIRPIVEHVRVVADGLSVTDIGWRDAIEPVRNLVGTLENQLLPHEHAEQAELLPAFARAMGAADPTDALSRTHGEIDHYVALLRRIVADIDATGEEEDIVELRRLLYGLHAVLRLHNAQEEEAVFSLLPEEGAGTQR